MPLYPVVAADRKYPALDGRARGLPKTVPPPARIVQVRGTVSIWNAAANGSMSQVPLVDSVLFFMFVNTDPYKVSATTWAEVCGGFNVTPIGFYGGSGGSTFLVMARRRPGRIITPSAAFNFSEGSANYRGLVGVECVVRDFRGEVAYSSADERGATSQTLTISALDGLGGIGLFAQNTDTGGSGPAYSSTTSPERVGSWSAGTGLLTLTNEPHRFAGSWSSSVTATRSPSIGWYSVPALVR